jgi:hypothetical protein
MYEKRRRDVLATSGSALTGSLAGCASEDLRGSTGADPTRADARTPAPDGQADTVGPEEGTKPVIHVWTGGSRPDRSIDPETSSTPVQDAIDHADSVGGAVQLPPGRIEEEGPIHLRDGVNVYGYGIGWAGHDGIETTIAITNTGVDGMTDAEAKGTGYRALTGTTLDGFVLEGPGGDADTGVGFHVTQGGGLLNCTFGALAVREFGNSSVRFAGDAFIFQVTWDLLLSQNNDPGTADAVADLDFQRVGNGLEFTHIACYPTNEHSGADLDTFRIGIPGGTTYYLRIGSLNVGGTPQRLGRISNAGCRIGFINFEPTVGSPPGLNEILELSGPSPVTSYVDHLKVGGEAEPEHAISLTHGAGKYVIGPIMNYGGRAEKLLEVADQPNDRVWFFGDSEQVTNTADSSTGFVRALGSAGDGLG